MAFPESIRLRDLPAGVPSEALVWLLDRKGRVAVTYEGYGMWPAVDSGSDLPVEPVGAGRPAAGEVVVVRGEGGRLGIRRVLGGSGGDGGWRVALDADPDSAGLLSPGDCLGRVPGIRRAGAGRMHRWLSPLARRLAEVRRVLAMDPGGGADPAATVRRKYEGQAETYFESDPQLPSPHVQAFLSRQTPGRRVLVVGCGTGTDLQVLLDMGHEPHGIDFSPGMVELARRRLQETTAPVERMDVRRLRFEAGTFVGVFFTPVVYSFLPGRDDRVATLRGLRRVLRPGGFLFLSARHYKDAWEWLLSRLYLAAHAGQSGGPREPGDWFTTFCLPGGGLGSSYVHMFAPHEVRGEIEEAGFTGTARRRDEWTARRD
jgi:SAM-dependent methyltransferase